MNSKRQFAAGAQLPDGNILVTGGAITHGANGTYLKSAEMLTEDGWESKIPDLPVTIGRHCMVTVNLTTVMVIGGYQNDEYSGKTFYFTFGEESWTEGPELKNKREFHSCGKIKRNKGSQAMSIIVTGGFDGSYMSSVEILDECSNEWQTGPELPFGLFSSEMVEGQNKGVVLIGGVSSSSVYLDTLYQLPHGGQDAVWTQMEQKMKTGRYQHVAFLIPDNIVDCS
jgi:N-acetylneuraminic acid mutarotase